MNCTLDRQGPDPFTALPFTAELIVEPYLSGVRIDTFLARHFRNYTSWRIMRMVRAGLAWVDDAPATANQRVFRGQRIRIRLVESPDKLIEPQPGPLDVLYEDPWLIALNKPAGQVVHPVADWQAETLSNVLQWHFDRQSLLPGLLRPGFVHRLDRETSGVIVCAKEHLSHRRLSIQFQQNRVSKTYVALVEGVVEADRGTIDQPIGRRPGRRSILMSAGPDAVAPRRARTEFAVVQRFAEQTLLEARPVTGRNHQIRVHFAAVGHPIVGDEFYGSFGEIKSSNRAGPCRPGPARQSCGRQAPALSDDAAMMARHALHALRIVFRHPITQEQTRVLAPLPADLRCLLDRLPARATSRR